MLYGRWRRNDGWTDSDKNKRKMDWWCESYCLYIGLLGHFFQSMTKANILPQSDLYRWFNTTIYYFHVPLFFICSGYLYQKYNKVNSVAVGIRMCQKKHCHSAYLMWLLRLLHGCWKKYSQVVLMTRLVVWAIHYFFTRQLRIGICTHCSSSFWLRRLLAVWKQQ